MIMRARRPWRISLGLVAGLLALGSAAAQQSGEGEPPPGEAAPAAPPPWTAGEAKVEVRWPTPPAPPAAELSARWVVRPDGAKMTLDGAPVAATWGGALAPGQALIVEGSGAQILLVWTLPGQGYELHQLLEAPLKVVVGADGRPRVEGLGWAHLFRSLAEALTPFSLSWESVDTGFESTEIAVALRKDVPWLMVVEGAVRLGERETPVGAGQWAEAEPGVRRARGAPTANLEAAVRRGTLAELTLLPPEASCPQANAEGILGAPLSSRVCFTDAAQRDGQLRASRQRALVDHVDEGGAFAALGDVYLSAGAFTEAAHAYRGALALGAAGAGRIGAELGNARWALGDAEGALGAYRAAAERSPGEAGIWLNRALAAGALGHLDEAREALKEATELDPGLGQAQLLFGQVQLAAGEAAGASQALLAARAAGVPMDAALYAQLTQALRQAGQGEKAAEIGRERTRQSPGDLRAWQDLARSLYAAGRQAEALRAYERALEIEMEGVKAGDR